ncbi:MAG TPA: hypothetical protein VL024_06535 [Castellaniella sp.]|nr:hypothetical protein [Castellaniella sp.]
MNIHHNMKRYGMGLALALGMSLAAQAGSYELGQKLTAEQITALGDLPSYTIDGAELRVLPGVLDGGQGTFLLNAQGAVGISRHEVMVADADEADLDAQLRMVQPQPVSVRRFAPTGITLAKFADFAHSVQGYEALSQAMPQATVRLSVVFGRKMPR